MIFSNAYKRLGLIASKIEESEKVSQAFKDRLVTIKIEFLVLKQLEHFIKFGTIQL